jgi:O-antigen ligase
MLTSENRWRWKAIISVLFLEAILLTDQWHPVASFYQTILCFILLLICLVFVSVTVSHLLPRDVLLLIVAFIPFDFSVSLPYVTALSTIDYLCAAALAVMVLKDGPAIFTAKVVNAFGITGMTLWVGFLLCIAVEGLVLRGNYRATFRWGEFLFCFYLAKRVPINERVIARNNLAALLAGLGSLCGVIGIIQFVSHGFDYTAAGATFYHHNGLSAFLSFCLPGSIAGAFTSKGNSKRLFLCAAFLISLGMLAAFSRGAIFSLIASSGLLLGVAYAYTPSHKRNSLNAAAVGIGLTIAIILPMSRKITQRIFESNGRIIYFQTGLKILKRHPWMGLGPGNYDNYIRDYLEGESLELYDVQLRSEKKIVFWVDLHDAYLQDAVDYGIIGFAWCMAGLIWILYPLKRIFSQEHFTIQSLPFAFSVCIVAFLMHNFVDILFTHSLDLLFVFLTVLASPETKADTVL